LKCRYFEEQVLMIKMGWLGRNYTINIVCDNCGKDCVIKIRKGISVQEAVKFKQIKCDNCGVIIDAKEYRTEWLQ